MDTRLGLVVRPAPLTSSGEGRLAWQGLAWLRAISTEARLANVVAARLLPARSDRLRPPHGEPSGAVVGRKVELAAAL